MNDISNRKYKNLGSTYWERSTKHIADNRIGSKHASSNHQICVDHVIQERQLRKECSSITRAADLERNKHTKRSTIETPIGNPAIKGSQKLNEG